MPERFLSSGAFTALILSGRWGIVKFRGLRRREKILLRTGEMVYKTRP